MGIENLAKDLLLRKRSSRGVLAFAAIVFVGAFFAPQAFAANRNDLFPIARTSKVAAKGARSSAILNSGKLLITASARTLVTSRQLTFYLPNKRIVVTPQGRKTYTHKRVPASVQETPPPALALAMFPKALKMKIAKEFGVKNVNLDDYELTLILDSADENDMGRLVGDGIAKTYGKGALRTGKDGNIYLDVLDDDLRELLTYIQYKLRIKRKSDGKFVENPQFVFRNPFKSEPPAPKPPVSPPF